MTRLEVGPYAEVFERLGGGGADRGNHDAAQRLAHAALDSFFSSYLEQVLYLDGCREHHHVSFALSEPPGRFAKRASVFRQSPLIDAYGGHFRASRAQPVEQVRVGFSVLLNGDMPFGPPGSGG